ncbi:MAG: hypothetical protein FWG01_03860 [Betaproteobacteria bacterium]|nr:hypothetical protein [Betaproteobacteria bacterium]
MRTKSKRPKPKKIREQEYTDGFNPDIIDEYDASFEVDDNSFYDMFHQMERDRSLGRDELYD